MGSDQFKSNGELTPEDVGDCCPSDEPAEGAGVQRAESSRERVVLIHGLGARAWMMRLLESRLRAQGWETLNWGYESFFASVESVAADFRSRLEQVDADREVERWHLLTHSMGGIVARRALLEGPLAKLQRVVMLAPPNQGSHAARQIGPWLRWLSPALLQLSDDPNSYVRGLGEPTAGEWGVIAAAHDRVVPVNSTHLLRPHDHRVLPTGHMRLLLRRDTARLAGSFLACGAFSCAASEVPVPADQVADERRESGVESRELEVGS